MENAGLNWLFLISLHIVIRFEKQNVLTESYLLQHITLTGFVLSSNFWYFTG